MTFTIANLLNQWEAIGVFDFVLPFLLIFAVVFGVLTATNVLSGNKGVNVLVALVIGLLALRLDFVPLFFAEVFPRLGVGLAVFLVLMILVGAFIPEGKGRTAMFWIFTGIGAVIAIIVLSGSFGAYGWTDGFVDSDLIVWIVSIALFIGVIVAVVVSKGDKSDKSKENPLLSLLRSNE